MLIERTQAIVRRFPVRTVAAPRPIPTTAYRAPSVSALVSSFSSASTPSVVRFASLSPIRPTVIPQFEQSSVGRFGSFLGGIVKTGANYAIRSIPGAGPIIGAGLDYLGARGKAPAGPTVLGNLPAIFTGTPPVTGGGVVKGGAPRLDALPGTVVQPGGPGVHIIKSQHGAVQGPPGTPGAYSYTGMTNRGHWKKDGQWSSRRRARMNPMNVRAGRRAIRRIHAAEKLFHRFLAVTHPGHVGHVKVKRGKR